MTINIIIIVLNAVLVIIFGIVAGVDIANGKKTIIIVTDILILGLWLACLVTRVLKL